MSIAHGTVRLGQVEKDPRDANGGCDISITRVDVLRHIPSVCNNQNNFGRGYFFFSVLTR